MVFDVLTIVLIIPITYIWWCCGRVSKWIRDHEAWLTEHHLRNAELERAVCRLENYVYQNPINPANIPPTEQRFCKVPNDPPDGWGGNPIPDGF
jgi:hypothetical protein